VERLVAEETPAASRIQKLQKVLEATGPSAAKLDGKLATYLTDKMIEIYAEAKGDYRKVPTYRQLRAWIGDRAGKELVDSHHVAVKSWAKAIMKGNSKYAGWSDAQFETFFQDMPAVALSKYEHGTKGSAGFNTILRRRMPYGSTTDQQAIRDGLRGAYAEWDELRGGHLGADVMDVVETWLNEVLQ